MMKQYVVDAFTDHVFAGNQAAVCVMESWPSETLMMKITKENNFSETAFTVKEGAAYHLRWFTPGGEIDLCGHATLATAYVLFHFYEKEAKQLTFTTLGGTLVVERKGDLLEMDFPAYELKPVAVTADMEEAIGVKPMAAYMGRDLLVVLDNEEQVWHLHPDMKKVKALPGELLQVTAKGTETDSVSRSFAPKMLVDEDPVCGSGHCHIVPYWAKTLGKPDIVAYQASERGGYLYCHMEGNRVKIAGKAALYSVATLYV